MYDIVMKWDWGTVKTNEYDDTETRGTALPTETIWPVWPKAHWRGKIDKAERWWTSPWKNARQVFWILYPLEPFIQNYYEIEKTEKARKVYEETSRFTPNTPPLWPYEPFRTIDNLEENLLKLNQYESLVEVVYVYDTKEYYQKGKKKNSRTSYSLSEGCLPVWEWTSTRSFCKKKSGPGFGFLVEPYWFFVWLRFHETS